MTRYFESSLIRLAMLIRLAIAAVVLCVALPVYAAQPTVRGVVTDPLGADVANARVELVTVQNVQTAGYTYTDAQGRYSLSPSQPGRYVLRVTANGFDVTYSHELYLRAGQPAYQDIALQLGKLAQSVTVTATGTATPQSQTGASVTVLDQTLYPHTQDMQDTLRMVNGLQFSTTGQRGATTSLFELGGNSNQTAVMVDGVPINDIGGAVNLAYLAANGINQTEIFRGPDSALYGADASAGVINLMTTRGTTTRPLVTYSVDGGNYGTYRQEGSLGGVHNALDYYSNFARFDTANSYPNSSFHNGSFAGNFGYAITPHTQLRATVRRVAAASGEPNALLFYGIPDTQYLKEHDLTSGVTLEDHATNALHFMAQYGMLRLRSLNTDPSPAGVLIDNPNNFNCYDNAGNPGQPEYVGLPVTITGGNGYTVSGRAFYNNCANSSFPGTDGTLTNRDFFYGQTDYTVNPKLVVFTAFRYESERGYTAYDYAQQSANRGNFDYIVQTSGNLGSRLYYSGGADLPNYSVFGFEPAPRGTVAYYLVKPSASGFFAGTKARFNFSKGILEPTIAEQRGSIYDVLQTLPNGQSLITKNGITPVGAQMARTYEGGVDQQLLGNRAVVHAGYFHNEFGNQIEFVYASALSQLGVPPAVVEEINNTAGGAYINSLSFRAQGLETSMEYRVSNRIFARGGYTYLNTNVQRSFSSDNEFPSINPRFPTIQIGAYSPLIGQRPFRRAPQSGFFSVTYAEPRWYAMVTGTTVGARDDSTFLLDANGGNTLLLPNHNLDPGYENIGLNVSYQINKHASAYGVVDNLLSQHYQQVIGYPSLPFNFRSGIEVSLGGAKQR